MDQTSALLHVEDCEPLVYECDACNGMRTRGDDWCPECAGDGIGYVFDRSAMFTLAHNLTIAAALCRAWRLYPTDWSPGCQRAAP